MMCCCENRSRSLKLVPIAISSIAIADVCFAADLGSSPPTTLIGNFGGGPTSDLLNIRNEVLTLYVDPFPLDDLTPEPPQNARQITIHQTWGAHDQLGAWNIGPDDKYWVSDFDGDGRDDVFVRSPEYAGLFMSRGDRLEQTWIVQDQLGEWNLGPDDQHWVGDFDGDGKDDVFVRSPEYAGLFMSRGDRLEQTWIVQDQLGEWNLGPDDQHWVGDFDGDGKHDLLTWNRRDTDWISIWTGDGTRLQVSWIKGESLAIPGVQYLLDLQRAGDVRIGRFNEDDNDDIVLLQPTEVQAILRGRQIGAPAVACARFSGYPNRSYDCFR
jgi:FG-GAP-like repeat